MKNKINHKFEIIIYLNIYLTILMTCAARNGTDTFKTCRVAKVSLLCPSLGRVLSKHHSLSSLSLAVWTHLQKQ